jgi:tyrosine-protein kinase Etk/Wzc
VTTQTISASDYRTERGALGDRLADGGDDLLNLMSLLVRHRRATVGFPLLVAVLTGVVTLLVPPTYTAITTFVPEASPQRVVPAGLAGLASQFGISLGSEASKSPKFYAEVVRSRELMEHILLSRYADPRQKQESQGDSATLLSILGVRGKDLADSLYRAVKKLNKLVSVTTNAQTNIVTLSVDARYATLAAEVANGFVAKLNAFNTQSRQSQAREQRKFVEQRLADGESALRAAEEDLRTFYERNRTWQQSPQLTFEEGRHRRQVEIRQELYLTLQREYEAARMQEVNDTPVITVIDSATPPAKRSKPQRILLTLTALVLGAMVGASWAAGADYVERVRRR